MENVDSAERVDVDFAQANYVGSAEGRAARRTFEHHVRKIFRVPSTLGILIDEIIRRVAVLDQKMKKDIAEPADHAAM